MLEFGSQVETPEVETATVKPSVGDRAETGIFQCCGKNCSCA